MPGVNPTPGVSAQELFSKLPPAAQERINNAKPEDRTRVIFQLATEYKDDAVVFEGLVNFQKADADEAAQRARAEAHDQAVKDVEQQKAEAAKLRETSKFEGNGATVTHLGNAEADHQTQLIDWTAPTERVEVHDKSDLKQKIKDNASYTSPDQVFLEKQADGSFKETRTVVAGKTYLDAKGKEVSGKDYLKIIKKQAEAEEKKADKDYDAAFKRYQKAEIGSKEEDEALLAMGDAATRRDSAATTRVEAGRARKTARGRGVGRMARAIIYSEKTDNDVVDRPMVVRSEAEKQAALRANPSLTNDNVAVLTEQDAKILQSLKQLADKHLKNIDKMPSVAAAEERQKWEALSRISLPQASDTPEQVEEKTRNNQTALRFLSGLDNTADPTEKRIIRDELKRLCSHGDLNHLYKTYGMHYTTRGEYKLLDAAKAALKAVPAAGLSAMAMAMQNITAIAKADAFVNGSITAEGTFRFQKTVVQQAIAFAEANIPGFTITSVDPETGLELVKQIAGQYVSDTELAEAVASIEYQAEAHAVDVKKGGPSVGSVLGTGATVIATAALIGFLTSPGNEKGVNKGDAKAYKDSLFIQLHSGAAQGMAQMLIEDKNRLIAKGMPEAQANQVLADFYGQAEGGQNNVMKMSEMGGLVRQFKAYVDNYDPSKKPDTKPTMETTPPTPPTPPVQEEPPAQTAETVPPKPESVTNYSVETKDLDKRIKYQAGKNQSPHFVGKMYKFVGPNGEEYDPGSEGGVGLRRRNPKLYNDFAKHVYGQAADDNVNKDLDNKGIYLYPQTMQLADGWKAVLVRDTMPDDVTSGRTKKGNGRRASGPAPKTTRGRMRRETEGSFTDNNGVDIDGRQNNVRNRDAQVVHHHYQDQGAKDTGKKLRQPNQ